jgi:pantetheine-phosphate adenylyltransferase
MIRKAIFAGSFDPPHMGHIDVIEQATKIFDIVYWAVANNPRKTTMFEIGHRLHMIEKIKFNRNLFNVRCVHFTGFTVDYALSVDADFLVRSVRGSTDFDYEQQMALVNTKLSARINTVYLPARQDNFHISSTLVRDLIRAGKPLEGFVPEELIVNGSIHAGIPE